MEKCEFWDKDKFKLGQKGWNLKKKLLTEIYFFNSINVIRKTF